MSDTRQLAHDLIDQLPDSQVSGLVQFLQSIVDPVAVALANAPLEDEEISEEEEQAVARSKEWFKHNKGIPHEQVVADLGLAMEPHEEHKDPAA